MPLVASGVLAGEACRRLTDFYPVLLSDPDGITRMLLWLAGALLALAVAGGITAALLGMGPIGLTALALATVGMVLVCKPGRMSGVGAIFFFVVTGWSLFTLHREIRARARFPAAWLGRASGGLLTGLCLAAGVAMYSGAERTVAEQGLVIPAQAWEVVSLASENYIGLFVPEGLRGPEIEQLNQAFQTYLRQRVEDMARPYLRYLPLVYAGLFVLLVLELSRLLPLLAGPALQAAIAVLLLARLVRFERTTVEIERLVPGWCGLRAWTLRGLCPRG
ncbi:MAG: hypothetical protein AB1449_06090 [Chloroflexota bacterium]